MRGFNPGRWSEPDYGGILDLHADVAIAGAGPAGVAAADTLARAGLTVALLDAGRHWTPRDFPRTMADALRHLYDGRGPLVAVGSTVIPVTAGRGVGGGSLINSAICFRAPPEVLREWREEAGAELFTDDRLGRIWDALWKRMDIGPDPLAVQGPNNRAFFRGAEALGLAPRWFERNTPGCLGCARCPLGCSAGGKNSVDRAILPEALETGRLGVFANCRVEAVEREGDRVRALLGSILDPETDAPRGALRVRADRFVLAMGAIRTPRFLLGTGLAGPPCGQHLHLHPAAGMLCRYPFPVDPWAGTTQGCYVDRRDEGYMLETVLLGPDQLYAMLPLPLGPELNARLADVAHVGSSGFMIRDEDSTGSVGLNGMRYALGPGDLRRFLAAMRRCSEVFFAAGATEVYPGVMGGVVLREPDDIPRAIHDGLRPHEIFVYASHPQGTARIHPDPRLGTVDPRGRVHGLANLHVVDGSVFPSAAGVNPMMTIMAVATALAEDLAGVG